MHEKDDLQENLNQINTLAEGTHLKIRNFIESNDEWRKLGPTRGPVPPKMEEFIGSLEQHARDIVKACDKLRTAYKHPHK